LIDLSLYLRENLYPRGNKNVYLTGNKDLKTKCAHNGGGAP